MPNEDHCRKLENMYVNAPVNDYYQPVIKVSEGSAEINIQAEEKYFHAGNAVHGHVYFKMLDDACVFAAMSLVENIFVYTASLNTHLLRPVNRGKITSKGKIIFTSKNLWVAEATLYNQDNKPIAHGTGNFVKSKIELTEDIGYKL